jgi:hypothetical protein
MFTDLVKAAQHKYIKRVPKAGGKGYVYYYSEGSATSAKIKEHMKEKAAFRLNYEGAVGHFHITAVKGDIVSVKHDGSGTSVSMTRDELAALLMREHAKTKTAPAPKPKREPKPEPKPEPKRDEPAPEPKRDEPAPEPKRDEPAPEPKRDEPAPEPKREGPLSAGENAASDTAYQLSARPEEIGDPSEWASRIQGAFRDSRGFVDSVIDTYTGGVNKINDLLRTTYATAPADKKQRIANYLERRLFQNATKTLESYTGVMSWFVTGRDGVSAKEREKRIAANERADRARQSSTAPLQIEKELQETLGRFSPEGEKALAGYNAVVELAEKMHTANVTMKDTSRPIEQRRAQVLELFADSPDIRASVAKKIGGRGAVFDAMFMHEMALEIQKRRRKARGYGLSVQLPEGFYENGIGNVAYGKK